MGAFFAKNVLFFSLEGFFSVLFFAKIYYDPCDMDYEQKFPKCLSKTCKYIHITASFGMCRVRKSQKLSVI